MNYIHINLKEFHNKQKVLSYLSMQVEGMFGKNYDALIDALTFYDTPLEICLYYYEKNAFTCEFLEILSLIHKENPLITYQIIN